MKYSSELFAALIIFVKLSLVRKVSSISYAEGLSVAKIKSKIKKLEDEIGHSLMEFDKGRVYLKEHGFLLYERTKYLIESVGMAFEKIDSDEMYKDKNLHIGVSGALHALMPIFNQYSARYQDVTLKISAIDLRGGLVTSFPDVIIECSNDLPLDYLITECVFRLKNIVVSSSSYLKEKQNGTDYNEDKTGFKNIQYADSKDDCIYLHEGKLDFGSLDVAYEGLFSNCSPQILPELVVSDDIKNGRLYKLNCHESFSLMKIYTLRNNKNNHVKNGFTSFMKFALPFWFEEFISPS